MALTKNGIDDLSYDTDGPSRQVVWDTQKGSGGVVGFGVRVYPSGSKAFIIKYRMQANGKTSVYTIGQYPTWTLQQARKRAKELLVEVDHGKDPAEPTKADEDITLAEYAVQFLDHMRTNEIKSIDRMQRRIYRWFVYHPELSPHYCPKCTKDQNQILGQCNKSGRKYPNGCDGKSVFGTYHRYELKTKPSLGKVLLKDITPTMVVKLRDRIAKSGKVEANRAMKLLYSMFAKSAVLVEGMKGHENPCSNLPQFKETSRTRYLSKDELVRLLAVLDDEPVWLRKLIKFYLVSGLRKMELLSLPWSAVKLNHPEGPHIDAKQTKNGRDLRLTLTDAMIAVLLEGPRTSEKWVFPSTRTSYGSHRVTFEAHWNRIRERAGLGDVTVHDLRRTAGTLMASAGVSLHQISEVLNHSSPEVTKIYARLTKDSQRSALEAITDSLDKLGELRLEA